MGSPSGGEKMPSGTSGRFTPEQRIGSRAVRGGFVAVSLDPRDLSLEHSDPFTQLALRIRIEAFLGKQRGGIAFWPRQIFVHCHAESDAAALLSMRPTAKAEIAWLAGNWGVIND
jgi:hypothetical protein